MWSRVPDIRLSEQDLWEIISFIIRPDKVTMESVIEQARTCSKDNMKASDAFSPAESEWPLYSEPKDPEPDDDVSYYLLYAGDRYVKSMRNGFVKFTLGEEND